MKNIKKKNHIYHKYSFNGMKILIFLETGKVNYLLIAYIYVIKEIMTIIS